MLLTEEVVERYRPGWEEFKVAATEAFALSNLSVYRPRQTEWPFAWEVIKDQDPNSVVDVGTDWLAGATMMRKFRFNEFYALQTAWDADDFGRFPPARHWSVKKAMWDHFTDEITLMGGDIPKSIGMIDANAYVDLIVNTSVMEHIPPDVAKDWMRAFRSLNCPMVITLDWLLGGGIGYGKPGNLYNHDYEGLFEGYHIHSQTNEYPWRDPSCLKNAVTEDWPEHGKLTALMYYLEPK